MNQIQDMRPATPLDFIEAWAGGVMYSPNPKQAAIQAVNDHPLPAGLEDPTFWTYEFGEGGERVVAWRSASEITNPEAMRKVKAYLYDRAILLPPEVSAAWAGIMERSQWAQNVREAFEEVLAVHAEASDLVGTVDLMARVSQALADRVE